MYSNLGHFWQGFLFLHNSLPKTLDETFLYDFEDLQNQLWTGIGQIDVDPKVCMTQIGSIWFYEPKFKNMYTGSKRLSFQ